MVSVGKINSGAIARSVVAGRGTKESILKGLAHSGLSGPLRSIVMNMLGKQERARFYLTHIESGEKFQFCMTPEEVNVKTTSSFRSFNVIEKGEVKIPKGEELTGVSWNGILPGDNASSYKFISEKIFEEKIWAVSPEILQEAAKIILSELDEAEEKICYLKRKNLPGEIWRDVDKRVGLYQVSNFGRVKVFCHKVPKILKQKTDTNEYYMINFHNEHKESKSPLVHRLVAEAFIPNPKNLPVIDHKDGNKQNNCVENLELVTYEENMYHAWKTGLIKKKNFPHGEEAFHAKLTNEQVRYIRKVFIKKYRNFGGAALARKFNVDPSTILRAVSGQNYSCVD